MKDNDIKRILSVGMTTMSDRLREYKDPFEPRELQLAPIDRRVGRGRACVVQDPGLNTYTDFPELRCMARRQRE
jgi:hypothetical protein